MIARFQLKHLFTSDIIIMKRNIHDPRDETSLRWLHVSEKLPMRHKILKDHAHVFCQMFMGWSMAADLPIFAALPDGQLQINVLNGTCNHSESGAINTQIAGEIRAWFLERLATSRIALDHVRNASLTVNIKNTIPSKHKMGITFDWTCDSIIETADRTYTSHLAEARTWMPMFISSRE